MKTIRRIAIAVVAIAAAACGAQAKIVKNYKSHSDDVLTFQVDSIDFRKDLTRVYGKVIGRPHTSHRIDGVTLNIDNQALVSDDIDGVDFKRYFQWEDDGFILLEIDFPATRPARNLNLNFNTVRGNATTIVKN
ncbi:MAG: hypothetical protein OSJ46_08185 [Duncaniella sp.]|nr:hypothetical protein [Duncaniella sp.]HBI58633.1 hypothetical protein [Porphyromonadaceae bacterium]